MPAFPLCKEGIDSSGSLTVCLEPRVGTVKNLCRTPGGQAGVDAPCLRGLRRLQRGKLESHVVIYWRVCFQDQLRSGAFPTKNKG